MPADTVLLGFDDCLHALRRPKPHRTFPDGCAPIYGAMTQNEIDTINQAIELLSQLAADEDESKGDNAVPSRCPVKRFAQEYLRPQADSDMSCAELWKFYCEIAEVGELPAMRKAVFLRRLPSVMDTSYAVRKCHDIQRAGRRLRGFRGIGIKLDS